MSYFSIFFVYLYYPMKFERKFLKGPPPLAPPCFEKSGPPPAEKKIGPPPLGFWSSPTYGPLSILESTIVLGKLMENFFRELHYKISSRILILVFFKKMTTCIENTIYL